MTVLETQDAKDLIVAAAGLLNIKAALISCAAALLFTVFMLSLAYDKCTNRKGSNLCACSKFVSERGSASYNCWALIYEKIESSTLNQLLRVAMECCNAIAPTPAPPPVLPAHEGPLHVPAGRPGALPAQATIAFAGGGGPRPAAGSQPGPAGAVATAQRPAGQVRASVETAFKNRLDIPVQVREGSKRREVERENGLLPGSLLPAHPPTHLPT
jgi:hypothetical protein